jgi:translocation and assembly module TamB
MNNNRDSNAKASSRRVWKIFLGLFICGAVLIGAFAWYLTSNSFQAFVRRQLVAELEQATGGRVEVGAFHTSPFRLRVEVLNITIHGREASGEVPYAHVDQLIAEIKIISLLEREFGLHSLVLERPVIHIIFYPDGTTNQPQPRNAVVGKDSIAQLFNFSISRLDIRQGKLIWDNQTIPLDFQGQNVSAELNYLLFSRRYDGRILIGKADTRLKDLRPFAWMADAQFSLGRDYVQIKSLHASIGRSHLDASGRIENLRQPQINLDYAVLADMGEAGAILRNRDIRRGVLEVRGQGTAAAGQFSSEGKIALTDFDGKFDTVTAAHASFSSPFKVTQERVSLSKIEASVFAGSISGDADIKNWHTSPDTTHGSRNKQGPSLEQQGTARLQFKNVSVSDVIAGVSLQNSILRRFNVSGDGSGAVQLHWRKTPRNVVAQIALDVTPPQKTNLGKLPLNAHMRGTYDGEAQDLELSEFSAATQNTRVTASGRLSSRAALRVSLESSNVGELQPAIASLGYANIPSFEQGAVWFNGTAAGRLSDYMISGNVRAQDFTVRLPIHEKGIAQQSHWDFFHASLQFSPEQIAVRNANLKTDDTTVNFDLSANLTDGQLLPQNAMTLRMDMHAADVHSLLELTQYRYPITGRMNLALRLSGTEADPHGEGSIALQGAEIYGKHLDQFNADLRLIHRQAEINNISMSSYGGTATGGILYDFHNKTGHFNINGENFDLAQFSAANRQMTLRGRLGFHAQGAGTLQAPVVQGDIHLRDVQAGNDHLGNVGLQLSAKNGQLHLEGQSEFQQSHMSLNGDVQLHGDLPTSATLQFTNWEINGLASRYVKAKLTGRSSVSGMLHVIGPLLRPREMNVTGSLTDVSLDAENLKLHNSAPVDFSVSRLLLRVQQFHLVGEGTDFTATGTLQLQPPYVMDWSARGNANLRLIETFDHDFTSRGRVTIRATGKGTLSQPTIDGQLDITRGSIAYINLPSALSEINGTVLFNQNEMKIQTLTARTGGGLITLSGGSTFYNHQLHFDLGVVGQDVRLRYPPGVSSTANVGLRFAGTPAASTLSGEITVTKLSVTPGFDFANYLARSGQPAVLAQTNTLLSHIALDVHITTTPELQMQTASVRFSGDADLRVRGTVQTPALLGRADILDGGQIYFNGSKYTLQRGDIVFLDPTAIAPILDLQASTQIRDYDITLRVTGDARHPTVNFQSEPPLPSSDIIALLALGRTNSEAGQAQLQSGLSPFNQEAGNVALAEAFSAAISDRVQRLFGGSRIKIDPQGLSTETSLARGPALTIEQQVAGNLTLTYTTNVSQTSQQIIQAQYNLSKNVSIVGIRDQNGVVSFDVKIRHRKK